MMGGGGEGGGGEGGGGGSGTSRELDHTPTWAVALVVSVIVVISIMLEQILHLLGRVYLDFNFYLEITMIIEI